MLGPIEPLPREPTVPEVAARYVRTEYGEDDASWLTAEPNGHVRSGPRGRGFFRSIATGARLFLLRPGAGRRAGRPSRSLAVAVAGGTVLAQDCPSGPAHGASEVASR